MSEDKTMRVSRGCVYSDGTRFARAANRINDAPFRCGRNLGLRLVEEVINEQE